MTSMEQLREHLMSTLTDLRSREQPMEIGRARAVAEVAAVLVDTARVEVDYLKVTGQEDSEFLGMKQVTGEKPGVLGSTVHKIR